ncbi:MAG: beta-ketoacyl synthase N-terminal-like domain-containing protein, partial [Thermodesulfovibrionales bacterium]
MTTYTDKKKRVVITGYGMITPLGINAQETFQNCKEGKSGIDYIRSFDTSALPCKIGGEVRDDCIDKGIAGKSAKYLSRGGLLFLHAIKEAYLMADLDSVKDRYRIGLSVGNHGDNPKIKDMNHLHRFFDGKDRWDLHSLDLNGGYNFLNFFKRKPDITSTIAAHTFDARGSNIVIVSACAAGAQAIGEAYKTIIDGKADVFIAGGAESVT